MVSLKASCESLWKIKFEPWVTDKKLKLIWFGIPFIFIISTQMHRSPEQRFQRTTNPSVSPTTSATRMSPKYNPINK